MDGTRPAGWAAVILAGGAGRRLGGAAKPTLPVAGSPMLLRVLAAVAAARARVVVGPPELAVLLPSGVRLTREQPPGGGPVAALAAGLDALSDGSGEVVLPGGSGEVVLPGGSGLVAVLAADLPLLSPASVDRLAAAVGVAHGAVYVDGAGRSQWLCGVWRCGVLARRLSELAATGPVAGRSLREVLGPLDPVTVSAGSSAPWYDCDTPEELAVADRIGRARERES